MWPCEALWLIIIVLYLSTWGNSFFHFVYTRTGQKYTNVSIVFVGRCPFLIYLFYILSKKKIFSTAYKGFKLVCFAKKIKGFQIKT